MRPTTLLTLCVFVTLALLATQARPAHGALILPLVIYKKLPKHDPTPHLKSLLQFINLDVIKGLVGQLINFEAILRHFSPAREDVDSRLADHGGDDDGRAETAPGFHDADAGRDADSADDAAGVPDASADSSDARDGSQPRESLSTRPAPVRMCTAQRLCRWRELAHARSGLFRVCVCPSVAKLLVPVPLPLPLPIPIPLVKPKMLSLLLPKLPRIGITLHLGKSSPLRHLRIHHKPKLVHLDHGHDDHDYHHSHSSHQPHHHHGPPPHSGEDEVYEVKNSPPQYPAKDWKS
ncbi:hypothetical protein HPB50_013942 [Hyalomma asiaticum]|uniref:Uncharacterized protein n=1 Tax=Hyalomma asiaticum TaxID=266040 RepID=A0ACB7S3H3_HYAAI|nr:hypothetical protein HPB50_013942 [Hyalomma asiaticum]